MEGNEHTDEMIYSLLHNLTMWTTKSSCFTAVCVRIKSSQLHQPEKTNLCLCENRGMMMMMTILSFTGGGFRQKIMFKSLSVFKSLQRDLRWKHPDSNEAQSSGFWDIHLLGCQPSWTGKQNLHPRCFRLVFNILSWFRFKRALF